MPEVSLAVPIAAVVLLGGATILFAVLWTRERDRADALATELDEERSRSRARGRPRGAAKALKTAFDAAVRVREEGVGSILMSSFEELAGWAEAEQPGLERIAGGDGTLAIVFSDIEDSTALNEELGDRDWVKVLSAHDKLVRRSVDEHGGYIVKSQGDGFMIAFGEPSEAVRASIGIQRSLKDGGGRRLRATPIRVRIGVHVGQAVTRDGDLFGRNVALAARVAAEAGGGEILVTPEVAEALGDDDGLSLSGEREVELKGLPGKHRLAAVAWE